MKRKLVQQGNNALTISLPYKWTSKLNLTKGDYVEVTDQGKDILVSSEKINNKKKYSIEISKSKPFFKRYIRSCYVLGYDEIEVYSDDRLPYNTIDESLNNLIGYEILSQQSRKCTIGIVSISDKDKIDILINKLFFMIQMMFDDIIEALENNKLDELSDVARTESSVNSFVDYCLRVLNKQGYNDYNKTQYVYHILTLIEEIADSLRDLCLGITKTNPSTIKNLRSLKDYFGMIFKMFLEYDMGKILEIKTKRKELIKITREECPETPLQSLDIYAILTFLHQLEVLIDPIKIKQINK